MFGILLGSVIVWIGVVTWIDLSVAEIRSLKGGDV